MTEGCPRPARPVRCGDEVVFTCDLDLGSARRPVAAARVVTRVTDMLCGAVRAEFDRGSVEGSAWPQQVAVFSAGCGHAEASEWVDFDTARLTTTNDAREG